MYILSFLHQTTTTCGKSTQSATVVYLIISTSNHNPSLIGSFVSTLYILSFLHQTTTLSLHLSKPLSCISYHFYIKPQLNLDSLNDLRSCISYHFYIKPQLFFPSALSFRSCISYHFYIKPQPPRCCRILRSVVYLIISTSNHNLVPCLKLLAVVVYLIISTSNHNLFGNYKFQVQLYILSFLHQTTTTPRPASVPKGCISYHFYIKPQPRIFMHGTRVVVYLIISTSNHNLSISF